MTLGGVCVAHFFLFSVLCFVCLHPVSCVPNVGCVSGLSILDCSSSFVLCLFDMGTVCDTFVDSDDNYLRDNCTVFEVWLIRWLPTEFSAKNVSTVYM